VISEAYNTHEGFEELEANLRHIGGNHTQLSCDSNLIPTTREEPTPLISNTSTTKGQSKLHSLYESLLGVVVGYIISMMAQLIIFPLYDIHISISDNLMIGIWFALVSIVTRYIIRRVFNKATITATTPSFIIEGTCNKGGININPSTNRPRPPKSQTHRG
jgi:hypothetical protein